MTCVISTHFAGQSESHATLVHPILQGSNLVGRSRWAHPRLSVQGNRILKLNYVKERRHEWGSYFQYSSWLMLKAPPDAIPQPEAVFNKYDGKIHHRFMFYFLSTVLRRWLSQKASFTFPRGLSLFFSFQIISLSIIFLLVFPSIIT